MNNSIKTIVREHEHRWVSGSRGSYNRIHGRLECTMCYETKSKYEHMQEVKRKNLPKDTVVKD